MLPVDGFTIQSEDDYGYKNPGARRKVVLWSKRTWESVDSFGCRRPRPETLTEQDDLLLRKIARIIHLTIDPEHVLGLPGLCVLLETLRSPVFEPDLTVLILPTIESTLMNEVMVVPAQQYEVVEAGLTAIGPVFDVVAVAELVVGAPGKAATAVSRPQRTPDSGWNRA